jgi:acetyl-CoA synthetase
LRTVAPGHSGDEALIADLQRHVRGRLAPYEYPKEVEFIDALPMTTTGKVQRRILRLREEERARSGDQVKGCTRSSPLNPGLAKPNANRVHC